MSAQRIDERRLANSGDARNSHASAATGMGQQSGEKLLSQFDVLG